MSSVERDGGWLVKVYAGARTSAYMTISATRQTGNRTGGTSHSFHEERASNIGNLSGAPQLLEFWTGRIVPER